MNTNKNQKVTILIDGPNQEKSSQQIHNAKIDYSCYLDQAGERSIIKSIVFLAGKGNGKRMQYVLQKMGFEIRIVNGKKTKMDCDVALAMHAVVMADKIDTLILASGDGDYCPLVQYLKIAKGLRVELMSIEQTVSYDLLQLVDEFIPVTKFLKIQ